LFKVCLKHTILPLSIPRNLGKLILIIVFAVNKATITLTLYFFIFACSDNDDSINSIVGNWQLTAISESGSPTHDSCDLKSNMTLLETNTGVFTQYHTDDTTSELCGESMSINLTWSQNSSSTYFLTFVEFDETNSAVLDGETLTINKGNEVIEFTKN
jgi:hypothetical protein